MVLRRASASSNMAATGAATVVAMSPCWPVPKLTLWMVKLPRLNALDLRSMQAAERLAVAK